jgi:hypothetical protein
VADDWVKNQLFLSLGEEEGFTSVAIPAKSYSPVVNRPGNPADGVANWTPGGCAIYGLKVFLRRFVCRQNGVKMCHEAAPHLNSSALHGLPILTSNDHP